MAAVASSRWMSHTGDGWGDPPQYNVKHFECLEKHYPVSPPAAADIIVDVA